MVMQQTPVQPAGSVVNEPIIDETAPEQVAIEEKVMAGEPVVPAEPAAETTETAAPPAAVSPPETPTPAKPAAPTPRVYTDEQVRQMQSSWDRQIAQERQRAAASEKRLQEFDLNASVEALLRQQEATLEPQLGADAARATVRTPENERQVREQISERQELRALRERERTTAAEAETQAAVVTAQLFTQRYGVSADDVELLLTAPTPVQMEKLAQRLGTKAKATTSAETARRGQVPVETSRTQLESGMSGTSAPESIDRMAERLNNVPSYEWTAREREFMRTGRIS